MVGISKNQILFIKKLMETSDKRSEEFQKFLKTIKKSDISELDRNEASELIDSLKKIKVDNDTHAEKTITSKQLKFIQNLNNSETRIRETNNFLKSHGNKSIEMLTIHESSELIDILKGISSPLNVNSGISKKQLDYIKKLEDSDNNIKKLNDYLKKINKKNINELTSKEASSLIDLLNSF